MLTGLVIVIYAAAVEVAFPGLTQHLEALKYSKRR